MNKYLLHFVCALFLRLHPSTNASVLQACPSAKKVYFFCNGRDAVLRLTYHCVFLTSYERYENKMIAI